MNDYNSAAGSAAAVNAGAIRAAIGTSRVGGGIPVGAVVRSSGAATAAHYECARGSWEGHAAETANDTGAIPTEAACAARAAVSACAAPAVLIVCGWIRIC